MNNFVYVVYRSRVESYQALHFLQRVGAYCRLASTPMQAGVGCGVCVATTYDVANRYRHQLSTADTFVGFFLQHQTAHGNVVVKIM